LFALFALFALIAVAACGSDGESSSSNTSSSSGGTGGACQPIALKPPAPGQVVVEATFSDPQAGYDGSTEPFTADPASSTVHFFGGTKSPYLWTALIKPQGMGDDGQRGIVIGIMPDVPLCTAQVTTNDLGAPPYFRYWEGSSTARQWVCAGSVVLDTLVGKEQTFHFDAACGPMPAANSGTGSVKVRGTGAATLK
jgi:hypothetical protein